MKYDFKQSEIFIDGDTTDFYIHDFQIRLADSILIHYPIEGDSISRSRINIDKYFLIDSREILKNKNVFFAIGTGIREEKRMVDRFDEYVWIDDVDSVYTMKCAAK